MTLGGPPSAQDPVNKEHATMTDDPVGKLSFVATRKRGKVPAGKLPRCFWNVNSTGDDRRDDALGKKLALEYLKYESAELADRGHPILANIVDDMPAMKGAVEMSFLHMVGFGLKGAYAEVKRITDYWDRCAAEQSEDRLKVAS
jgi:hypothetical protein